jgi:hypothetical protein
MSSRWKNSREKKKISAEAVIFLAVKCHICRLTLKFTPSWSGHNGFSCCDIVTAGPKSVSSLNVPGLKDVVVKE